MEFNTIQQRKSAHNLRDAHCVSETVGKGKRRREKKKRRGESRKKNSKREKGMRESAESQRMRGNQVVARTQ